MTQTKDLSYMFGTTRIQIIKFKNTKFPSYAIYVFNDYFEYSLYSEFTTRILLYQLIIQAVIEFQILIVKHAPIFGEITLPVTKIDPLRFGPYFEMIEKNMKDVLDNNLKGHMEYRQIKTT